MTQLDKLPKQSTQLKIYTFYLAAAWTLAIVLVAGIHARQAKQNIHKMARIEAAHAFDKDLVYRLWSTGHGGVYVPVTESMHPNPHLAHIKHRDITTTTGQALTLVNPAFMTRQTQELGRELYGHQGHITSLNLLRPDNAPDDWEREALQAFERGESVVVEQSDIEGKPYLRFMRSLIVKAGCLKCHAQQGYKVGDIRGGISFSIPMDERFALLKTHLFSSSLSYGFLWLLGLGGIAFGSSRNIARIRERENAESALLISQGKLKEAQRIAKIGNWELNLSNNALTWSDEVYCIFDIAPQQFPATYEDFLDIVHPEDSDYVNQTYAQSVEKKQPYSIIYRLVLPDSTLKYVNERCETSYDKDGNPDRSFGTIQDVTENILAENKRKELEIQLRQKHKMEAVGHMAGGMAHNFNNNLSIILGNVELSQLKQAPNNEVTPLLENAKIAIRRSRDLVQKIITYSRKGIQNKTPIQLPAIVTETISLIRSTLSTTISIEQVVDPACGSIVVDADASQIHEVLVNLCNNAVHAMDEKGVLRISLDSVELTQQDIPAQYEQIAGHYAKLSIQDTGNGMPAEMLDKIFDPFFTTKEEYEGAGMGMATVQGIVVQHGGIIKVNSVPDQGTVFDLYFPIVDVEMS